jgi:thiol-disulfide isomerase/thioredoxin
MEKKIISISQYKNSSKQKNIKMFFFVILVGAIIGALLWNYFVENVNNLNVAIPPSKDILFNEREPIAMTTTQIANEFESADNKPILLYIYTTWCKICSKNLPIINEVAREFQETELQVITLAIDRDLTAEELKAYLGKFGNIYFQPRFLAFKEGFMEFLRKKNINYNNRIPFTVLISRDDEVMMKYVGVKGKNYLRNQVIKAIK